MSGRLRDRFGECPVAVVDEEVVVTLEVIRDVEVGAAIAIQIARDDAESIAVDSVANPGRGCDVGEMISIIAKEPVAGGWFVCDAAAALCDASGGGAWRTLRLPRCAHPSFCMRRVIEQV